MSKTLPLVAFFLLAATPAGAVEVTAGGVFNPLGYLVGVGMEMKSGENIGIEVTGSQLTYEYHETGYDEWGSGPVLGARARFYPQATGNNTRLWLAAGLSFARVSWEWQEKESGEILDEDEGTTTGFIASGGVGYKVLLADDRFVLDPQLFVGYLAGGETDTNVVAGLGLSAGLRF